MKKFATSFALVLALALNAAAQVTAEVALEQDQFLMGEEVTAAVKIINRSGQTLQFGDDPNWLNFTVEARDGLGVAKEGEVPVLGEFSLESGQVATRRVNLSPNFDLKRAGSYRINATVNIKEWNRTITATPKSFDVVKGARIWSQEFGLPLPAGASNRPPEVRRYTLEQANHLRSQLRLYLRITDLTDAEVIKVVPIGGMVSFSHPERQIDRLNRLHVLYQNGAKSYLYTVVSPDGDVLLRQTHEITTSRPRLKADEEGGFLVMGGARRLSLDDLPAPGTTQANGSPEKL